MPVETTAVFISDLNPAWPLGASDQVSDLDDSIQIIKTVLQNTFSAITGEVTATHTELNIMDGVTCATADINKLTGSSAGTVLTTGDEGAGNGIDADTLDGQEGAYYQDASNLNAGTIPAARLPNATDSAVGGLETSTAAEAKAGTATNKIITPAIQRGLGGQVLLETVNPSAASTVDFGTVFETYTDFDYFIIRGHLYNSSNGANLSLRVSTDSGSTFSASAIYYHAVSGTTMATSPTTISQIAQVQTSMLLIPSMASSAGLYNHMFEFKMFNPQDTTSIKWLSGDAIYEYSTPIPAEVDFKGAISSTSAVDGFRLLTSAGSVTGQVQVYGII